MFQKSDRLRDVDKRDMHNEKDKRKDTRKRERNKQERLNQASRGLRSHVHAPCENFLENHYGKIQGAWMTSP